MGEPSSWSHEVNKVPETRPNSPPLMADKLSSWQNTNGMQCTLFKTDIIL